jgi:hypothetical protein
VPGQEICQHELREAGILHSLIKNKGLDGLVFGGKAHWEKKHTRPFRILSCKTDFFKAIFSTISGGEQGRVCTPEDVFCTR